MATNIGKITFGVDVNTSGMAKGLRAMNALEKKTNDMARSSAKGAKAAVLSYAKQESAIKAALQATVNLQKQQRKAGASRQQIGATTKAFNELAQTLARGKLEVHEYNRAMDIFKAKMGKARRATNDLKNSMQAGEKTGRNWKVIFRDLESSAVLALGPLSGLGARIRSLSAIFGRGSGGFSWVVLGAVAALAVMVVGFGALAVAAARAGQQLKSLQLRFDAATGSSFKGNRELAFTIDLARSLGLEVSALAKGYSRFLAASAGTNLEGEKSRRVFTQVAKAAAALNLTGADTEGVMRAIEQMMSKGTVQAEELRGQLGDRLPGAFRMAAQAMGVTTRELNVMLKSGEVITDEFLPKFGNVIEEQLGRKAVANLNTYGGAWNRLKTTVFQFLLAFDKLPEVLIPKQYENEMNSTFSGLGIKGVQFLEWFARGITPAVEKTEELTGAWQGAIKALDDFERGPDLGKPFIAMHKAMKESLKTLAETDQAMMHFSQRGGDIQDTIDRLKGMRLIAKANRDEITLMSGNLEMFLGIPVEDSVQGVADAFEELFRRQRMSTEHFDKLKAQPAALEAVSDTIREMALSLKDLESNAADPIAFADQEKDIRAFANSLDGTMWSQVELTAVTDLYRQLLIKLNAAQSAAEATQQRLKEKQTAAIKAQEDKNKTIVAAARALEDLRIKTEAISNPDIGKDEYDKIIKPIEAWRKTLTDAGHDVGVVNAFLKVFEAELRRGKAAMDQLGKNEVLKKLAGDTETLRSKVAALALGPAEADTFTKVEVKVREYADALREAGKTGQELNDMIALRRALLTAEQILILRNTEATKAAAAAEREAKRAAEARVTALEKAAVVTAELAANIAAQSSGDVDAFERYQKVLAPLQEFIQDLHDQDVAQAVINQRSREYQALLEEQYRLTNRLSRAADSMAAATTSALEDIILKGGSVRNMLHELAKELLRVALRAMFLDQLQHSLGGFFNSFLDNGASSVVAGAASPGILTTHAPMSTGGSFKVGGAGGSDKALVSFMAKPGEVVSVQRPDQRGGGGGGGASVVVNQYNTFENSGNAETLIPILEENNRLIKAEFLDELDRGAYG